MSKSCKQNGIRYDPRIKLLQVLIIGILVFTLTGKKYEVLLFVSICIWNDKRHIQNLFKIIFSFIYSVVYGSGNKSIIYFNYNTLFCPMFYNIDTCSYKYD